MPCRTVSRAARSAPGPRRSGADAHTRRAAERDGLNLINGPLTPHPSQDHLVILKEAVSDGGRRQVGPIVSPAADRP